MASQSVTSGIVEFLSISEILSNKKTDLMFYAGTKNNKKIYDTFYLSIMFQVKMDRAFCERFGDVFDVSFSKR